MSTMRKERSTVRFAKGTKTLPSLTHMYRPELHRQMTERVPVSRLGHELNQLCQTGLGEAFNAGSIAQAKLELTELMDKLRPSLKRNRMNLDIRPPVLLHCFPHWHVTPDTVIVCLLPVTFPSVKVIQSSIGHALIKLPPVQKDGSRGSSMSHANQQTADIRCEDYIYLSPSKLSKACTSLLDKFLLKQGVAKDRFYVNCDLSMTLWLDCGWQAEVVPGVAVAEAADTYYYVSRMFPMESYENEDLTWTTFSSVKDQDVLNSISSTDGGVRVKAMYLVCRLLSCDWRLDHLSCYHVQTALLHDMDFHVDSSPRWQRSTLEFCITSLLKTLLYFLDRGNLPHFGCYQVNLWEDMTQRKLALARGALSRLLTNENALISLVRRASSKGVMGANMNLFRFT